MVNYIALGKQIRKLRRQRNWTQENLAEKANLAVSFLGHIERGSRKASIETVVNLANALDVDTDALLNESLQCISTPYALTEKQRAVVREAVRILADQMDV